MERMAQRMMERYAPMLTDEVFNVLLTWAEAVAETKGVVPRYQQRQLQDAAQQQTEE